MLYVLYVPPYAYQPRPCCTYHVTVAPQVAIAARHALARHPRTVRRVLVLDWDVHHGNGTEQMFDNDDRVLYMSLHRFGKGKPKPKPQPKRTPKRTPQPQAQPQPQPQPQPRPRPHPNPNPNPEP